MESNASTIPCGPPTPEEGTGEPGRPGQRRAQEEQVGRFCSSSVLPVFQPNFQYLHSLQRTHRIVLGHVDPCFVGLVVAFDWISSIFKFLFEEFVNVIFPSFSWSPDRSVGPCILCSVQGSSQQPFSAICRLVKWRFTMPVSISFFCESCSSIESSRFPSFLWLLRCFSLCVRSSLLLRLMWYQFFSQDRLQIKRHCLRHCELLCSVRHRFHHQCYTFH